MRFLTFTACIAGMMCLHLTAVAQDSDGLVDVQVDDLKPDGIFGESIAVPSLTASFDFLTDEDDFLRGATLSIMPLVNYFDQRSGDLQGRTGGGVLIDLSIPFGPQRNLVAHGGASATFDSMSANTSTSIDFSKLADLQNFDDGTQTVWDRLVIGFGVDLFTIDDAPSGDRELLMAQFKFAVGTALTELMDIGAAFGWPLSDATRGVRPSSQFKFYWAGTLTNTVEAVAFVGTHDFPNTGYVGCDIAWIPLNNYAVHCGMAIDDAVNRNATFYVGIQHLLGTNRSMDSRQRGYHHRLSRGGMFRTMLPGDGEFFRERPAF